MCLLFKTTKLHTAFTCGQSMACLQYWSYSEQQQNQADYWSIAFHTNNNGTQFDQDPCSLGIAPEHNQSECNWHSKHCTWISVQLYTPSLLPTAAADEGLNLTCNLVAYLTSNLM